MMSKKHLAALSLISLILFTNSLWGQELPSNRWWQSQNLGQQLDLTGAQINQLEQLHIESHHKLNKLKMAVEDAEFELDDLLGQKSMSDDEVNKQFDRLEETRTNLANEQLRFAVRLREIIGDEGLEQLKIAYEKWQ